MHRSKWVALLDRLVGADEQCSWDDEPEGLCGLQVDD